MRRSTFSSEPPSCRYFHLPLRQKKGEAGGSKSILNPVHAALSSLRVMRFASSLIVAFLQVIQIQGVPHYSFWKAF